MKRSLALALAILALGALAACANSVQGGLHSFNAGNYEQAYDRWFPLAQRGDPAAQHNMGVLWQQGLSTRTPTNADRSSEYFLLAARQGFVQAMVPLAGYQLERGYRDAAISWLTMAARWNDQNAVLALSRLGVNVPPPDLAQAHQQAQADAGVILAASIACALSGGCGAVQRPNPLLNQPTPQPRQCVYWTPQGTRTVLAVNGVCPARYGE